MPQWEVGWTPRGPILADEYMLYLREKGTEEWAPVASTRANSYMLNIAKTSIMHEVGIAPMVKGLEAPEESWSIVEFRPDDTTDLSVPDDVSDLSGAQSGNYVILTWSKVAQEDVEYYEIRMGTSWALGVVVHRASAQDELAQFGWWYSGSVTYHIKARTVAGLWSNASDSITLTIEPEDYYPAQATYDEHAGGYSGTKSGTEVSSSNLTIEAAPATASAWTDTANTYTWPPLFPHLSTGTYVTAAKDAGAVLWEKVEVSITPTLPTTTVNADEWRMILKPDQDGSGNYTDIGTRTTLDKVTADGTELIDGFGLKVEIDTTPDDPASSPTWDGWRRWVPGALYYYRGVRVRLTLSSVWYWNPTLTSFSWRRRRQNRKDEVVATLSATGGTAVTWDTVFTAAPKVVATPVASVALHAVVNSITTSGCDVRVFDNDGNEQSSGTVHVHAMGV